MGDKPEGAFWHYHSRPSLAFDIFMIMLDLVVTIIPFITNMNMLTVLRVLRFSRYARVRHRLSLAAAVHGWRTQWLVAEPAVLIIACFHALACGFYLVSADNQQEP